LIGLLASFRVALARLKGAAPPPDIQAAEAELADYEGRAFPVFVAADWSRLIGYLLCRVQDKTVWAEQVFVVPECRRQGVASALYREAEKLAEELGSSSVYNWIHPNNDAIVEFLRSRGYDVLNLVEIRKPRPGETPAAMMTVGDHEFRY
jgi:ribosomal protein S18 acetylase RimI-like enzyme